MGSFLPAMHGENISVLCISVGSFLPSIFGENNFVLCIICMGSFVPYHVRSVTVLFFAFVWVVLYPRLQILLFLAFVWVESINKGDN